MKLPKQDRPILRVPAPVQEAAGLGDVIKGLTRAVGFKPCGGCERRAEALNRMVSFTPFGAGGSGDHSG